MEKEKDSGCQMAEALKQSLQDDPAQTDPPTPILLEQEPIPNPDLPEGK